MTKIKEVDLTLTLRSAEPVKIKKFQQLIDQILAEGTEAVGVEDDSLVLVNIDASEIRKVEPFTGLDTPVDPFVTVSAVGQSPSTDWGGIDTSFDPDVPAFGAGDATYNDDLLSFVAEADVDGLNMEVDPLDHA